MKWNEIKWQKRQQKIKFMSFTKEVLLLFAGRVYWIVMCVCIFYPLHAHFRHLLSSLKTQQTCYSKLSFNIMLFKWNMVHSENHSLVFKKKCLWLTKQKSKLERLKGHTYCYYHQLTPWTQASSLDDMCVHTHSLSFTAPVLQLEGLGIKALFCMLTQSIPLR